MKYWDNEVTFTCKEGLSITGGSYEIGDFSISPGEDPDKHIYQGARSPVVNSSLYFKIGHSGTTKVADWFNRQLSSTQTTFGHSADKLNFALMGTLNLTLSGSWLGGKTDNFTFSGVALAQGHAGGNNWWFGGKQCTNIGSNKVKCIGKNSKGHEITAVFRRGDNDIKTIELESISVLDLAAWMKNIDDNKLLGDLMMPGSHDAGMSELHHCSDSTGALVGPFTQTQSKSVGGQLACGSRYFDIRVDYDHSALVTCHRTKGNGCNGQDLKDVLDEAVSFLNAHPSETFILKFSHLREFGDHHKKDTGEKIVEMLKDYEAYMYKTPAANPFNLAEQPIKALRGKMIVVFSDHEFCKLDEGRFRYNEGTTLFSNVNLTVYDNYADKQGYDDMKADQIKKWKDYAPAGRKYFFLLSWTLTPKQFVIWNSVENLAAKANKELPAVLTDHIVSKGYSKPNVVYIDYINEATTQSIILFNY